MKQAVEHQRPAAVLLFVLAALDVVGVAYRSHLIGFMLRGWILNAEAYPWWRLTALYSFVEWLWMVLAAVPTLICAAALAWRASAAAWIGRLIALVGSSLKVVRVGASLLL